MTTFSRGIQPRRELRAQLSEGTFPQRQPGSEWKTREADLQSQDHRHGQRDHEVRVRVGEGHDPHAQPQAVQPGLRDDTGLLVIELQ